MHTCPHCQTTISKTDFSGRCPNCDELLKDVEGDSKDTEATKPDLSLPAAQRPSAHDATVNNYVAPSGEDSSAILETYIHTTWGSHIDGEAADVHESIRAGVNEDYDPDLTLVIPLRNFGQTDTDRDITDYDLLEMLGEGGVGVVYAARQASIDRTVAIKMLKPKLSNDAKYQSRFLAEAAVTGELEHPNIVPIYELGRNADGSLFYSMKRVQGTPWDEVIGNKTEGENIEILMKVCDAVAFAHSHRRAIVHRDLKPNNVMLGEFGEVLVMDWGLAISTANRLPNEDNTKKTILAGTPSYMAPEMARGPIGNIGTKSDIYLLGAILYKIVTGMAPHSGHNQLACLMNAARNSIAATTVNGELIEIARKAMETNPENRYKTVGEFQTAVREYQSHLASNVATDLATYALKVGREENDYNAFSKALFGFQQALEGWPQNLQAEKGYAETVMAYAQCAATKEDYDLGLSLLRNDDKNNAKRSRTQPGRAELEKRLLAGKAESDSRQQRIRRLKQVAAILFATVAVVVSVALVIVSDQLRKAEFAERQERKAKEEAISAKITAELATKREEQAKVKAITQERAKVVALAQANIALAEAAWLNGNATSMRQHLEDCPIELRDSSWNYFHEKLNSRIATVIRPEKTGHDFVRYWPGDETHEPSFVSNDRFGHLRFYDCRTGEFRRELKLTNGSRYYSFSADGKLVATAGRRLRVHNAVDGKQLAEFKLPKGGMSNIWFTPDGKYLACRGNNPRDVHLVDWKEGEILWTIQASEAVRSSAIGQMAIDPTGKLIAVHFLSPTQEVWILDIETGERIRTMAPGNGFLWTLQFSDDGTLLAGGDYQGYATVWQVDQGTVRLRIRAGDAALRTLAFTPQHHLITMAAESSGENSRQRLRMWELSNGTELDGRLDVPVNGSFALAPNTMHVFCSGKEGTLWRFPSETPKYQWQSQISNPVAFLGDHFLFAGAEDLRAYALHDLQAENFKQRPWAIPDSMSREQAVANGDYNDAIVTENSASYNGAAKNILRIQMQDNQPGEPESIADHLHADQICFAKQKPVFASFSKRLQVAKLILKVRVTELGGQDYSWEFDPKTRKCISLAFVNNDEQVLGVFPLPEDTRPENSEFGNKSVLYVLDAQSGEELNSILFPEELNAMATNPKGDRVAVSGQDKLITIYDAAQLIKDPTQPVNKATQIDAALQFRAHDSAVTTLAWHPNLPIIASGSNDLSIKLWNAETGELLKTILGPVRAPRSLAFNASGKLLASSAEDNHVRVWEIDAMKLLSSAPNAK